MNALKILFVVVVLCGHTAFAVAEEICGTVTDVVDGDTFRIMSNDPLPEGVHAVILDRHAKNVAGEQAIVTTYSAPDTDAYYIRYQYPASRRERWYSFYTVRLQGIDAPELSQPGGEEARAALASKLAEQPVVVTVHQRDDYGRLLGSVRRADGRDVAAEMLREGQAYHYKHYSRDPHLAVAEREARDTPRGVWAHTQREKPWVYRRRTARTVEAPATKDYDRDSPTHVPQTTVASRKRAQSVTTWAATTSADPHMVRPDGTSHGNKIYVRGYTRADGTKVSGYWRSTPTRSSGSAGTSGSSGQRGSAASTVSVRGYYRSDGTYVHGYTRAAPSRSGGRGK